MRFYRTSSKSNTKIILNATIKVEENNFNGYRALFVDNKKNIEITGCGSIIGDKDNHNNSEDTNEYCHGVAIHNSHNINISNISVCKFPGDGIYVGQFENSERLNRITLSNCDIHDCGRQGISLVGTKGVIIENCDIYNIGGTSPQSAIDIEPNDNTQISYNTIIRNNNIKNCYEGIFIVGYNAKVSNIEITSNAIESDNNGIYVSSYSDDPVTKGVSNINIRNNTISGGKFGINIPKSRNVEITNNYVYSESGYAMYFNPKNRAINVANNVTLSKIGILSGGSICLIGNIIDIISDEENVYALNIDNTSEYGSLVKSNKINGKVKLYSSSLDFSDNHVKHKLYSSNDVVSGNLINISDNKFEILDNENISVAGTDTCLNFYGLNSRIKNNIFCFPDNKTSYVIKVNASANKNEIRYNEFSNLPANKTIYVNSKENIIEGLFSNLRKSDIVPEYINTKRDYQAENVLFVNSETRRILSSDGNAVYDALGFPVAQPYKEGQTMYDSTLKKMKLWNGVDWTNLDGTPL